MVLLRSSSSEGGLGGMVPLHFATGNFLKMKFKIYQTFVRAFFTGRSLKGFQKNLYKSLQKTRVWPEIAKKPVLKGGGFLPVAEVLESNELKNEGGFSMVRTNWLLRRRKVVFFVQKFLARGECVRSHSSSVLHLDYCQIYSKGFRCTKL